MRNCWMPVLTVTGASGLPPASMAGNVLRTETQLKLSVRLPPAVDSVKASALLKEILERDPPYNAKCQLHPRGTRDWMGCAAASKVA